MSRMRRRRRTSDERTVELTGADASMDEAEYGDAGNGADPDGGDLAGRPPQPLEPDPADPEDILPDQIRRFPHTRRMEDESEVTARPNESRHPKPPDRG